MYFYDTYDVSFPLYIRLLVKATVASDLVSFVNNRTINSIRASLDFACASLAQLTSHRTLVLGSSPKTHPLRLGLSPKSAIRSYPDRVSFALTY